MTKEIKSEIREALEIIKSKKEKLSKEDELFIITQVQAGDDFAFEILEAKFAGYIDKMIQRFLSTCDTYISQEELKADCRKVLWEAARNFDLGRDCRLMTYMNMSLKKEMYNSCSFAKGMTRQQNDVSLKIKRCIDHHAMTDGVMPSYEGIAEETGLSVKYVSQWFALGMGQDNVSLDDDNSTGGLSVRDMVDAQRHEDNTESIVDNIVLTDALEKLEPEVKDVIFRLFGLDGREPETKKSIAASKHCSYEHIMTLYKIGIKMLRKELDYDTGRE